jgi:hypothetical protein
MATINVKDAVGTSTPIEKPNANGQATMAASRPVVLASDHAPIPLAEVTSWLPAYDGSNGGQSPLHVDDIGNLNCRSQVLTDEGGFRINFANASTWASIGTLTFTNGSDTVTGGTNLLSVDVNIGDYVRLDADGVQMQVTLITDTTITLDGVYTGTGGTGAASRSKVMLSISAGATATVSNGQMLFASGTGANEVSYIARLIDVPALVTNSQIALSQRIANTAFYVGFADNPNPTLAKSYAFLVFDGTTATSCRLVTARNPIAVPTGGEIQTQTLTITTTATASEFRLELLRDRATALQADLYKGTNKTALPAQSDMLYFVQAWVNGATPPATSTTTTIDFAQVANNNELAVSLITREPLPVQSSTASPVIARITDGTNYMPTADAAARRHYAQLTDGTNSASVLATILALKTDMSSIAGTATVNGGVAGTLAVGGIGADAAALSGQTMGIGGSDGTNKQKVRAQANNSALGAAGNLTVIPSYYNSAVQAYTSGNVAFQTADRAGRQAMFAAGTPDPLLLGVTASVLDVAAGTNATVLKATAGIVYEVSAVNNAAYDVFIKLANKATAPTPGTDISYRVLRVPAGQTAQAVIPAVGWYFATGIGYSITKLVGKLDTTAVVAGDVQLTIEWI